ncbi:hypothetical protein [Acinetobacter shaoyimingii]|uniref:Uncharacterized protein n=1 Tax=Acinetobacter shaoyimingii TaxID=2715164 RepID=A0A6G8RY08_9GAMM|nr:hypothetical protein [Acinetobacter shaoyimingii]QIO06688.1 hypothetical protein G8E00_12420 [Acinetobacter shaoyimingii]
MRIQKSMTAFIVALSAVSLNATAAIVNNVDFPEQFTQAKEKSHVPSQDQQMTASAQTQN